MALAFHNTLSRKKEAFVPLHADRVGLYVCGPTVYDYAHIGNARPVVVFDVLYRLLKHLYPDRKITYVRNITDVDDKINAAAKASGEPIRAITERTAMAYREDMGALGTLPPDIEPRATEHIARMIEMIEELVRRGHAYAADGHALFNVPSMAEYGKLSGRNRDELIAGARVEVAPYKKDPADFVLWKPSTDDLPGWESPWGRGRPGWHIECSAMSTQYLGDTFDIHGGGVDLVFPHHENEIAQSRCATGHPFVRYWLHNGHLMAEGEKMSKSLGNFYTVHDLLTEFPGEAIRLTLLQSQYRQPMDFTKAGIAEAKGTLDRFYAALAQAQDVAPADGGNLPEGFLEALEDDLNTPLAISQLHKALAQLNGAIEKRDAGLASAKGRLLAAGALLGLLQQAPEAWRRWQPAGRQSLSDEAIEALILERTNARKNKDFKTSDRIRDDLAGKGVILEDGPGGTVWRRG
jgi:cysteinyl-tRNA synthetase